MASPQALDRIAQLRANLKPPRPLAVERADWEAEAAAEPLPDGTVVTPAVVGGIASEWIACGPVAERGTVLFLHGGGHRAGSLITHRGFAARLSRRLGRRVLLPDYRLAPEHPYPAGLEDAASAYAALLGNGVPAGEVVLFGDSAGGGLAISLMLKLRAEKGPMPAGAVLLSPWTDLGCSGASYGRNIPTDPFMSRDDLLSAADDYRGTLPADDAMVSPIHADLSGLPPMLIQAGGGEIMLDDSVIFAERAIAAGSPARLDVTPELWHVFQSAPDDIPEVRAAFARIAAFVAGLLPPAGAA